jgi:hypothetical protein
MKTTALHSLSLYLQACLQIKLKVASKQLLIIFFFFTSSSSLIFLFFTLLFSQIFFSLSSSQLSFLNSIVVIYVHDQQTGLMGGTFLIQSRFNFSVHCKRDKKSVLTIFSQRFSAVQGKFRPLQTPSHT